jgi:hypothetical protein
MNEKHFVLFQIKTFHILEAINPFPRIVEATLLVETSHQKLKLP